MHTYPTLMPNVKSEIIYFYNKTKGGVDTFQMCALYSAGRKTKRWPISVFYRMINVSVVNPYLVYKENQQKTGGNPMERGKYMEDLAGGLITPWTQTRMLIKLIYVTSHQIVDQQYLQHPFTCQDCSSRPHSDHREHGSYGAMLTVLENQRQEDTQQVLKLWTPCVPSPHLYLLVLGLPTLIQFLPVRI